MRVGRNPNTTAQAMTLEPIVLSAVTYLPNEDGYHAKRLEVIKTCLLSMRQNAETKHSFIVWDNGSIPQLKDWIRKVIRPDVFIESINLGKGFAKAAIARMLPSKTIMGFSDDDILFTKNWLKPQIELLQHFPNVSLVTGYPIRTSFRWGCENTIRWAKQNGELEAGRFLSDEWERDFAVSIGRPVDIHEEGTRQDLDYRVKYKGKSAYCTGHHCQFVGYAGRLAEIAVSDGLAMGTEKPFDLRADEKGLRLATTNRLTRHIGNVLDEEMRKNVEIRW